MHVVIYDERGVEWPAFVDFWSAVYTTEDEDPDRPDSQFLKHLRWPGGRLTQDDVDFLFEWKNGRKLSRAKKRAPERLKRRLPALNSIRGASYDVLWPEVQELTEAPVWGRFICHLVSPEQCPIWDRNVLRAYQVIRRRAVDPDGIYDDDAYRDYMRFFRTAEKRVSRKGGLPAFRRLDQALFSFGSRHISSACPNP